MSDRSYNGFSWSERVRTAKHYYEDIRSGCRPRHTVCMGCLNSRVRITGHSEDYSEPYGDHVGAFGFCYACHTLLHLREQCDTEWRKYRASIRKGYRWTASRFGLVAIQPILRDLRNDWTQTLFPQGLPFEVGMLDLIDRGTFDPRNPDGIARCADPLRILAEYCPDHPLIAQ